MIDAPAELGLVEILAVADGRRLELGQGLRQSIAVHRLHVLEALGNETPVYGVNTGMGASSEVRLDTLAQSLQQDNLMLARAVGSAPWLDLTEIRAAMALRLRSFLNGDAGVSVELCQRLVELLNRDLHPAIPGTRIGAAGEIIPLAHLGGCITGSGQFLNSSETRPRPNPPDSQNDNDTQDAREALAAAGLEPLSLGPKEGVALIEGIPVTTALATLQCRAAREFAGQTMATLAAGLVLIGANRDPFREAAARANPELARVVGTVWQLAGDQDMPRGLQAPVSFRVAGPAIAQLLRSVGALEQAVHRAVDGVTDSPAFLDGRFTGTAGFDGFDLSAALDALRVSLIHLAETSAARLHRLIDERVTGLPRQLSYLPGLHGGMVAVHKRAVGVTHALLGHSRPASLGAIETSLGQEDVQSYSMEAAAACAEALENARDVLACELLALVQATRLSQGMPERYDNPLRDLIGRVSDALPAGILDRPFGRDIAVIVRLLADGWARDLAPGPLSNPGG